MRNYLEDKKDKILSKYNMRFFPKQKKRLLSFIEEELNQLGWQSQIVKGNLVVGDIEQAEYIFTAHYDTPGKMPSYFSILFKFFGHTRQILMGVVFYILYLIYIIAIFFLTDSIILPGFIVGILKNIPLIWLFVAIFIPNKNNYNDNTSGVLTLMNIANEISNNNELSARKEKIAFVFFNNEEWGLLGSSAVKRYWNKNKISLENKKIVNFDCVGNGDTIMITHGKDYDFAKQAEEILKKTTDKKIVKFKYNILPLSDDFTFKKNNSIGIVFCKESIIPKGYYIPLVHSSKDTVLNLSNIQWLTDETLNLIEISKHG